MSDPVAGTFTGLHATISLAGSQDYVTTEGDYDIQNEFEEVAPTGDAFAHQVWVGRKLNKLSVNREMLDGTWVMNLINSAAITGSVKTLVTAGASLNTAGIMTLAGTDAGSGRIRVTTAGTTTTSTTVLTFYGTDTNDNPIQDYVTIPSGTVAAATFTTSKVFKTCTQIVNGTAAASGATCGIATIAGTTTSGVTAADTPATFTIAMSLLHPTTGKSVVMTFLNCMVKSAPVSIKGRKAIPQAIEFVMQNPNTDISATFI
jgi:hypothetical protein